MECKAFTPALAAVIRQRCTEQILATQQRVALRHTGRTLSPVVEHNSGGGGHAAEPPLTVESIGVYEAVLQSLTRAHTDAANGLRAAVQDVIRTTALFPVTAPSPTSLLSLVAAMLMEKERVWLLLAAFVASSDRRFADIMVAVRTLLGAARANPVSLLWDLGGSVREAVWLDAVARMQQGGGGNSADGGGDNVVLRGLVGRWQDAGESAADRTRAYIPTQALYVPTFVDDEGRVYCCPVGTTAASSSDSLLVACWIESGESNRRRAHPRGVGTPPSMATHHSTLRETHPAMLFGGGDLQYTRPPWWGCQLPLPPRADSRGMVLSGNGYMWAPDRLLVAISGVDVPWAPRGDRETKTARFMCARYRMAVIRRQTTTPYW